MFPPSEFPPPDHPARTQTPQGEGEREEPQASRLLAGDIGGTKTDVALYVRAADGSFHQERHERYASKDFEGLGPLLRRFLDGAPAVDAAGFGVAGPVEGNRSKATNLPWVIDGSQLARSLGIPRVGLVNDFHAVALSVPLLGPADLHVLQAGTPDPTGPLAILGAGTGLGEAVVLPTSEGRCRVLASEGGHVDFAPRDEVEIALLRYLMRQHGRVSVERVVSGRGLVKLYEFLVEEGLERESPAIRAAMRREDPGKVIGDAALQGSDRACERAVELFVSAYGAEAGNLALKVLPTGGLFVAGGIAPKLLQKLTEGPFMDAFAHKGRMSPLLERIPVSVVLDPQVGLIGAREHARALIEA